VRGKELSSPAHRCGKKGPNCVFTTGETHQKINYAHVAIDNDVSVAAESRTERRILLVDQHPIFRMGLRFLLRQQKDLFLCEEADNASDAINLCDEFTPDLVVTGLVLHDSTGFHFLDEARHRNPDLKILILSAYDENQFAPRLIREGASGYVMKNNSPEIILKAINVVLSGEKYVSDDIAQYFLSTALTESPGEALTVRQLDIFTLVGAGNSADGLG